MEKDEPDMKGWMDNAIALVSQIRCGDSVHITGLLIEHRVIQRRKEKVNKRMAD